MKIEIQNVAKRFGAHQALDGITLNVPSGELVSLLGPSGCGKTTLLRIVAGLEFADSGTVLFDGENTADWKARERRVGFVFQHYALFRHMNVFENVAFGLKVKPRSERSSASEIRDKVQNLLSVVQIEHLSDRFPDQLSGGQRQRVALARALAVEPRMLLLDEPFGALDANVRRDLRRWLRDLHDRIGITSLFVTHDQEEALEVADRVVILNHGRIEQEGPPGEVYAHPANPFVLRFLGNVNLFHGRFAEDRFIPMGSGGPLLNTGGPSVRLYVRPHEIELHLDPLENSIAADIVTMRAAGAVYRLTLRTVTGDAVEAELASDRALALGVEAGSRVYVSLRSTRVFQEELDYVI